MCIVQAMYIFAAGIVGGAFFMGTFAVHPAATRLDPTPHIVLRQELIRRLQRCLPPFMLFAVAASVGALALCRAAVSWRLDLAGCALSLATIGITVTINAPVNRRFARWSAVDLPVDWERHVRRWNVAHSIRTVVSLAAFACAVLAAG